jgi:hypothetical protein
MISSRHFEKALPHGSSSTKGSLCYLSFSPTYSLLSFRLYYQHNPARLGTCTVTIHALLHIADSIEACGPVWASWAYPTERFCGKLQRAVKGRRYVWASIDNWALRSAQAAHIRFVYSLTADDFRFGRAPKRNEVKIGPPCEFSWSMRYMSLTQHIDSCQITTTRSPRRIRDFMATDSRKASLVSSTSSLPRFELASVSISGLIPSRCIYYPWPSSAGLVFRLSTEETPSTSSLVWVTDDGIVHFFEYVLQVLSLTLVCTDDLIQYDAFVDQNERRPHAPEDLVEQSFFGSLQHVLSLELPASRELNLSRPLPLVFVAVRTCITSTFSPVANYDIHYYSRLGGLNLVDLKTVQCLIGRVQVNNSFTILDRTGSLQRAWYNEDDDDDD